MKVFFFHIFVTIAVLFIISMSCYCCTLSKILKEKKKNNEERPLNKSVETFDSYKVV